MTDYLNIILVDNSGNIIENIDLEKPNTYQDLLNTLKNNYPYLPKYFTLFYKTENNTEIEIHTNEEYKLSPNYIFMRKIEKIDLTQSVFTRNYNKLSENKKDILNEKYNCVICYSMIKEDNPYYCYVCQKNFHKQCLESWGKEKKLRHKMLSCPNCRHELPLEQWKNNINYEKKRRNEIEIINELNKNIISYNKYKEKTSNIFKGILYKLNEMHSRIKPGINEKLLNLTNILSSDLKNPPLNDISITAGEELDELKEFIKSKNQNNINKELNSNGIYITYYVEEKYVGINKLFEKVFVDNNRNNIDLIINGKKLSICSTYNLNYGTNTIQMIIKKNITNLEYMFSECPALRDIEGLQNLNTKNVNNFSHMFYGTRLRSLKGLEKWDASKGENFSYMFSNNIHLRDLKPLENWNVSKGDNFSNMFDYCKELSDISSLKNWNVSKGTNFSGMFSFCKKLKDFSALSKWDVSNAKHLDHMFQHCESLTNIFFLKNWNVSNCGNFSNMFGKCKSLINLIGVKNWNVSKGYNFSAMFVECKKLKDLSPIVKWNVAKGTNFNYMFYGCDSLSNVYVLRKLNFSGKDYYKSMFDNKTLMR